MLKNDNELRRNNSTSRLPNMNELKRQTSIKKVNKGSEIAKLKRDLENSKSELREAKSLIESLEDKNKKYKKMLAESQFVSSLEKMESQSLIDETKDLLKRCEDLLCDTREQNTILKSKTKDLSKLFIMDRKDVQTTEKSQDFENNTKKEIAEQKLDKDERDESCDENEKFEETLSEMFARLEQKKDKVPNLKKLSPYGSWNQSMEVTIIAQNLHSGIGAVLNHFCKD
ncbi:hypothetical protein EV44_g6232 [Erysiphe necator]|uniref:Uncharacterized protein n=1 Tax=Uncinula necator TaxID=52586 RepID=A0A0B1P3R2_UNCNE|nr:hypothetical protein EV44_g6232 [Erysiphe necator]